MFIATVSYDDVDVQQCLPAIFNNVRLEHFQICRFCDVTSCNKCLGVKQSLLPKKRNEVYTAVLFFGVSTHFFAKRLLHTERYQAPCQIDRSRALNAEQDVFSAPPSADTERERHCRTAIADTLVPYCYRWAANSPAIKCWFLPCVEDTYKVNARDWEDIWCDLQEELFPAETVAEQFASNDIRSFFSSPSSCK